MKPENKRMALARQSGRGFRPDSGGLAWARELMALEGVTQKDVARKWEVSESSVSRWLDGLQSSDISAARAAAFSILVKRSIEEIMTRLGHDVWTSGGVPRVQPLTSAGTPPVPTTSLKPGSREGWFFLLLHLELPASSVAAIINTLGAPEDTVRGSVSELAQ